MDGEHGVFCVVCTAFLTKKLLCGDGMLTVVMELLQSAVEQYGFGVTP